MRLRRQDHKCNELQAHAWRHASGSSLEGRLQWRRMPLAGVLAGTPMLVHACLPAASCLAKSTSGQAAGKLGFRAALAVPGGSPLVKAPACVFLTHVKWLPASFVVVLHCSDRPASEVSSLCVQAAKALASGLHMHGVAASSLGWRSPWASGSAAGFSPAVPAGPQRLPSHAHMVFMSPEWLKSCVEPNQLVHAKGCDM